MVKVLTFIFFLIGFFTLVLSCIFTKNNKFIEDYEIPEKYLNSEYYLQKNVLDKCKNEYSEQTISEIEEWITYYVKQATEMINDELNSDDQLRFINRKFTECLEIIAEHKANISFCQVFLDKFVEYDILSIYSYLEHDKCVKIKNKNYITQILYEIPSILLKKYK
ncbi:hypothetical protein GVAV_001999 [Gurleya vavrai]